jgi:transketolase
MDHRKKEITHLTANAIRQLSIEAVQKANSGHPGLPLGCADIAAYLYAHVLKHHPRHPQWLNRDRFVLSAGHGSMLLYSALHLSGFDLSLEEIKNFRQWHSKTPGHPEYRETPGVEATTGPLGQGVGNAIGQALGLKILSQKFNRPEFPLFTGKVFCLAGDGCLMEGVSQEAASFAGHLALDNFILIHDANQVTLDGPLADSGSDDIALRFRSYGFEVVEMDGHSISDIEKVFSHVLANQTKPVLIIAHTVIGKGSPNRQGTSKAHGSPLGDEELKLTKKALNLPDEPFFVDPQVVAFFRKKLDEQNLMEERWDEMLQQYRQAFPQNHAELMAMKAGQVPLHLEKELSAMNLEQPMATRASSQEVIGKLADCIPYLIGGAADTSESDRTHIKKSGLITRKDFTQKNIKFGIREFGMATIAAGLYQTQMFVPFIGTFLTFSDYMRPAIRLACLGGYQVIYQFTHDSIFLGEDGPTHQPVEQIMSLRLIPRIHVIRPADSHEVKAAWYAALTYKEGPTALILSRQSVPVLAGSNIPYEKGIMKGAYIIQKEQHPLRYVFIASGSEVSLACKAALELEQKGEGARVVSMPCMELFRKQPKSYQQQILGDATIKKISIEAGVTFGYAEWVGQEGIRIGVDRFGASAPDKVLEKQYGFTVEAVIDAIKR